MNTVYTQADSGLNAFYSKIYGLVGLGISLSAVVTWAMLTVFQDLFLSLLYRGSFFMLVLWLVQVGLVMLASGAAAKNSPAALPLFLGYSAYTGFIMSFTVAYYTQSSVLLAFLSAAGVFFAMALVGRFIKKDLSGLHKAFMAGLMGLIIAGLLNMFFRSSGLSFLMSLVSVVLFSGIIAYDNQMIKRVYQSTGGAVLSLIHI